MLAFDQHAEPYAGSAGFAVRTMTGDVEMAHAHVVRALAEAEWRSIGTLIGVSSVAGNATAVAGGGDAAGVPYVRTEENGAEYDEEVSAAFSAMWVAAIAHGVVGIFVGAVLRIPRLGSEGIKQLAADVNHLSAVLSAVGAGLNPIVLGAQLTPLALLRDLHDTLVCSRTE